MTGPTIRDLARAELAAIKSRPAAAESDADLREVVRLLAQLLEKSDRRRPT
jgi:hypothetical protein